MKYLELSVWIVIVILSIKNANIDLDMKVIDSYKHNTFVLFNNPPFNGLFDFFLYEVIPVHFSNYAIYILKCLLLLNNNFSTILSCLIFSLPDFKPSCATIFSIYALFNDNIFYRSIFISLSLVSDLSSVFLIIILIVQITYNTYLFLIDNKKSVINTLVKYFINIFFILSTVICTYLLIFYIDYNIRYNIYDYNDLSLGFSGSFNNPNLQPTHEYITHGSLISIINMYHKCYLGSQGKDSVLGNRRSQDNNVWRILKTEGEGDIQNNDLVRLVNMKLQTVLSLNNVNNTDKFFNVELSDRDKVLQSKNDIFRVVCDKKLKARQNAFQLVNVNTGLYLGMRKINQNKQDELNVYASIYSNNKHRLWYISDNERNDDTTKIMLNYPKISLIQKIIEHTRHIINNVLIEDNIHSRLFLLLVPIISLYIIISKILKNRGYKSKNVSSLLITFFVNTVLLRFIYCGDRNVLMVNQVIVNYLFIKEVHKFSVYVYLLISLVFLIHR